MFIFPVRHGGLLLVSLFLSILADDAYAQPTTIQEYVAELKKKRAGSIAGVAVGALMDPTGFTCEGVTCTKVATIAGEVGELSVKLCGSTVREVAFRFMFVEATEAHLALAQVAPWIRVALIPAQAASLSMQSLSSGLSASGWVERTDLRESQNVGSDKHLRQTYADAYGNTRRLLFSSSQTQFGIGYIVTLVTWPEPTCTSGL